MKEYQIEFLKDNVGFHFTDLSMKRQVELRSLMDNEGFSFLYVYGALSFKTRLEWEKWGFGLFFVDNFSERVFDYLDAVEECSEEELRGSTKKDFINYSSPRTVIKYNRLNLNKLSENKGYYLYFDDMLGWQIKEAEWKIENQ